MKPIVKRAMICFRKLFCSFGNRFTPSGGDSKITTWMYRIALNTAISGLRKLGRKIKTEELDDYHFNISERAEDSREEELQKLHWAIRQLTEIERAMIMMALDEVPYDEIAETIGITQNNVRVRMNRIREKTA
jgi:RNA polymerase sigma-70 factor (ECF subfamily)